MQRTYEKMTIPTSIVHLFELVIDMYESACISGSLCLIEYMKNLSQDISFVNNDVDIFILNKMKRNFILDTSLTYDSSRKCGYLLRAFEKKHDYAIEMKRHEGTEQYTYTDALELNGIEAVYVFDIKNFVNEEVEGCHKVNLIYIADKWLSNTKMLSEEHLWNEYVSNTFDINICTGVIVIDGINGLSHPFFSDDVKCDINDKKFKYTVRPGCTFENMMKRMMKYASRKFSLRKIEYEYDTDSTYKNYVERGFGRIFWPQQLKEVMDVASRETNTSFDDIYKHVRSFLGKPSTIEQNIYLYGTVLPNIWLNVTNLETTKIDSLNFLSRQCVEKNKVDAINRIIMWWRKLKEKNRLLK
jgi:hypothetical protein